MSDSQQDLPGVAIVANSQTPYRLHLHRRIARELSQVKLWSVYTHEASAGADWQFDAPPEIGPVLFGRGQSSAEQASLRFALCEWRKAGRIIHWMRDQGVRAAVIMGYNDVGRLRIIRWCHRNRIPCFLFGDSNIRGDRARGLKAVVKRLLVSWAVRNCTGVFCCGTLGRAYFMKYGARAERIYFFPYEPDYTLIEEVTTEEARSVAARFNLQLDRHRIVYSGRLAPEKRVDVLLDAFARIAAQRADWDLLIIGDGPLREESEERVPPELTGRVVWTGFVDDQRMIGALYKASDILVLPSEYEPWAVVITEAAAAGLAIIASHAVGAAVEVVKDGINGRLVATGSIEALADALLDVTETARLPAMKHASAACLNDWRRRGDPVEGLRNALRNFGIVNASKAG